ncbi:hypothetical protein [uncultured Albimonas sp.]|uniref:hypothetical protein n=1 Tax=uncultured Albimonas sp. TaxID=1331701 RepID=UPI0030EF5A8D|tara:strand:+ start:156 stop:539 length:384 start_codon:yes stop_codon:yes gene_type:complete
MAAFVPDRVSRLPNDIGGAEAGPIVQVEHTLLPWEKRCHALADVLDFRKIVNTEEKRKGVEALGETLIGQLPYYERWTVAFANILFAKGLLTPSELARKMQEVEARFPPVEASVAPDAEGRASGAKR